MSQGGKRARAAPLRKREAPRVARDADSPSRRIQSIGVGFRVVRAIVRSPGMDSLKEIATACGMAPAKVHPYLASFLHEGIISRDASTGRYQLGAFAVELGLAAVRQCDVVTQSQSMLERLNALTGCAAYVSVWGERGPMIARRIDGDRQGSMTIRVGFVLPLLQTATGQVFAAHMPASVVEAVLDTVATGTASHDRTAAQRRLQSLTEQVRRDGFATSVGQFNVGFTAFSAPVFDYAGDIAAALTTIGPSEILAEAERPAVIKLLLSCAAELSGKLGYAGAWEERNGGSAGA